MGNPVDSPANGASVDSRDAAARQALPGLRLLRPLARGGFAEVWEAEQISLGRRVAVKILRAELLNQADMVQLFEQEARVLARLNHPNVVQVIDRGASPKGPYFVMEHIEGQTLQDLLTSGRLGREGALTVLMQATRGLAYAHRSQVIHRDVKPANVLVSNTGQVKLSDFGIAAVQVAVQRSAEQDSGPTGKARALGTRVFMAPEQRAAFNAVGPEADVYSLGVILHRIVTGKLPPAPGRLAANVAIPARLMTIIAKALAPSPEDRFPNAGAFREALVNALGGRHIEDRVKAGASSAIAASTSGFELLDVIRQDAWRSVYLVRKGGEDGERFVVKRYRRDPDALRTLRSLVRVEHPNIVRIHAVGERPDAFIMLMEHLPGGDLRERLVRPHHWLEVARVGRDVAAALAHAHRHGIVHGNLRPSNVLFDNQGGVRTTDFGLPEHYRGEPGKRNWYAAPEGGRSIAADLFALGAILFEMLYAAPAPEYAPEQAEIMRRRDDVPFPLLAVVHRLLAPLPQRYTTADAVARDLAALQDEEHQRLQERAGGAPLEAARAPRPPAPRRTLAPALIGLGGLLLIWLLERDLVQRLLVALLAH